MCVRGTVEVNVLRRPRYLRRDGIALLPGEGGAEQTQSLARTGGTFQKSIRLTRNGRGQVTRVKHVVSYPAQLMIFWRVDVRKIV